LGDISLRFPGEVWNSGRGQQIVYDIVKEVERLRPGTIIPKPDAKGDFLVKRWGGARRGEPALIYTIPNWNKPDRPYEKCITASEWKSAFDRSMSAGAFSRQWFDVFMPECAREGGCNFTTIGGIFELLGYAVHETGEYRKVRS
jgi:hypothetical protein